MTADEVGRMKRREFVTLIGGAAAWPIAARAQRSGAKRRIVVVGQLAPGDVETVARSAAFEQALAALGWTKGDTIAIDYRWIGVNPALAEKTAVEVVALAPARGVEPIPINPSDVADMERRITAFASVPNGGMIATVGGGIATHRATVIATANTNHLPATYPYRYYAADGGLVSYGPDTVDQYRRAASYIDRILKGEKPANLPVQGPTKYELTINVKTAKKLGLTVPQSIFVRAD